MKVERRKVVDQHPLQKKSSVKPTRTALMAVFLLLCLSLYSLIHFSVLLTLKAWIPSQTTTQVITVLWVVSILALFISKIHHNFITNLLYRLGVTWMGISFLLFIVLFPATMITIAFGGDLNILIMLPAILLIMVATWLAASTKTKEIDVAVSRLQKKFDGLRIVHLTDIHAGEIYNSWFIKRIVEKTNKLKPDVIVLTGDVFDGGGRTYPHMIEPLKDLKAKQGVFYARGNHDVYEGIEETDRLINECGVTILDDAVAETEALMIAGLSYPSDLHDDKREVLKKLVAKSTKQNPKKPLVLLRHEPKDPQLASELGVDLMLSGHTHNGQLWPLNYLVKLSYPFVIGRHRLRQMTLYIGPGIGTWGPPFRLGSRSEITLIKLQHVK